MRVRLCNECLVKRNIMTSIMVRQPWSWTFSLSLSLFCVCGSLYPSVSHTHTRRVCDYYNVWTVTSSFHAPTDWFDWVTAAVTFWDFGPKFEWIFGCESAAYCDPGPLFLVDDQGFLHYFLYHYVLSTTATATVCRSFDSECFFMWTQCQHPPLWAAVQLKRIC